MILFFVIAIIGTAGLLLDIDLLDGRLSLEYMLGAAAVVLAIALIFYLFRHRIIIMSRGFPYYHSILFLLMFAFVLYRIMGAYSEYELMDILYYYLVYDVLLLTSWMVDLSDWKVNNHNRMLGIRGRFKDSLEPLMADIRAENHELRNRLNQLESTVNDSSESHDDELVKLLKQRRSRYARSGVALEHDVNVDTERFRECFEEFVIITSNLMDNGFEAIADKEWENKKVVLYYAVSDNHGNPEMHIRVSNSGVTLKEEQFREYLKLGVTSKDTRDQETEDHGIGLYTVKRIVRSRQGSIYLDTGEGQTTINVRLPFIANEDME